MAGLIPGNAPTLLQLDLTVLLAFIEAVVCESEKNAEQVQKMYEAARPVRRRADGELRRAEVAQFMAIAG